MPRALVAWAMDGADIQYAKPSVKLCKEIAAPFWGDDGEGLRPWAALTLVVVAGRGGWVLPTADSRADGRALVEVARRGCEGSRGVVHVGCRHPWNRQLPGLFAEAVRAWVEEGETVGGFESL